MGTNRTGTVEPAVSKRPSKHEERVYLDEDLIGFLERLQKQKKFRRLSQALRHCIEQQYARDPILPSEGTDSALLSRAQTGS
jgi:hypothetical protein